MNKKISPSEQSDFQQNATTSNISDCEILTNCADIVTYFFKAKDPYIRKGMAMMVGRNHARTLFEMSYAEDGDKFHEENGETCLRRQFIASNGEVEMRLFCSKATGDIRLECYGDNPQCAALYVLARESLGLWLQCEVTDWQRIA